MGAGNNGAAMKDLQARKDLQTKTAPPETPSRTAQDGPLAADVARELLAQPDSGVTRIAYVGLPEREAVQLVIDARYDGLHTATTRGTIGRVSVTLTAPAAAEADAAPGPSVATAQTDGCQRAWARLWASGQRVTCLLGRRTS